MVQAAGGLKGRERLPGFFTSQHKLTPPRFNTSQLFVAAEMVAVVGMGQVSVTGATSEFVGIHWRKLSCSLPCKKTWLSLNVQDRPLCKGMSGVHWDKAARPQGFEVGCKVWLS